MDNILVSSCLLGKNTKYNGSNNYISTIELLKMKYNIIEVCPEVLGGLLIPRSPAEIINNKVINKDGIDVTSNYIKGANKALNLALKYNCKIAVLKEKSPSCGVFKIYDGSFSKILIDGMGITTKLLKEKGIKVYSEFELEQLL